MITEWQCDIYASTSNCFVTASTTLFERELGSISFGLAILIVLVFLMTVGFMYNNLFSKKPWH